MKFLNNVIKTLVKRALLLCYYVFCQLYCGDSIRARFLNFFLACQTIHFTDCHVDCYGENELYLYYESTSLYIRQKLGMQKGMSNCT